MHLPYNGLEILPVLDYTTFIYYNFPMLLSVQIHSKSPCFYIFLNRFVIALCLCTLPYLLFVCLLQEQKCLLFNSFHTGESIAVQYLT